MGYQLWNIIVFDYLFVFTLIHFNYLIIMSEFHKKVKLANKYNILQAPGIQYLKLEYQK